MVAGVTAQTDASMVGVQLKSMSNISESPAAVILYFKFLEGGFTDNETPIDSVFACITESISSERILRERDEKWLLPPADLRRLQNFHSVPRSVSL